MKFNTLILGASYGSLLGTKMALAGHAVTLICTEPTARLINANGTVVRFPVRGLDEPVIVASAGLAGEITATTPAKANVDDYDLVVLAMQEQQYQNPEVSALMDRVAYANIPCVAIMNMPPLPYIKRLPGVDAKAVAQCYSDTAVWDNFNPDVVTLASPDPQAFRPPDSPKNELQVSLPTNFKVARFASDKHTSMLRTIESDILGVRYPINGVESNVVETIGAETELPVKLKVHDSLYVPLAKWSMLMTGNYRCVQRDAMIPIQEAVHRDIEQSKSIYEWTADLCKKLGADASDLVPFEKYASAAKGLSQPSSAAKALARGATAIERVDKLVHLLAKQQGMNNPLIDEIVEKVQWHLDRNTPQNTSLRNAAGGR